MPRSIRESLESQLLSGLVLFCLIARIRTELHSGGGTERSRGSRKNSSAHSSFGQVAARVVAADGRQPCALTSGLDGQPPGLKPRDKGRRGRSSNSAGRNVSEVRAGPESPNADADPPSFRGRPRGRGSNRQAHPLRSAGVLGTARWKSDTGYQGRRVLGEGSGLNVAFRRRLGRESDRCRVTVEAG
jgi:hypothetical protein